MRINGTGRGAQAGQRSGFDAAICRQPRTPDIPQAGLAQREPAIGFDALASLARDEFVPEFERIFGLDNIRLPHRIRENIEIMDFSEQVLDTLEVIAPRGVLLR